nr:hypothetical protein [Tanacetum cinerariifolium]
MSRVTDLQKLEQRKIKAGDEPPPTFGSPLGKERRWLTSTVLLDLCIWRGQGGPWRLAIFAPSQVGYQKWGEVHLPPLFSFAPASEGLLPSTFLLILLLSLFRVSSNPTMLSYYLRIMGDLVQSGRVASLVCLGLGFISSSSS